MADADEDYLESWEELSRAELVEECKARGLQITGGKNVLIQRLETHEASAVAEDEPKLPFGEGSNPYDPPEESGKAEEPVDAPEVVEKGQGDPDPDPNPEEPADKPSGPPSPPEQAPVPSGHTYHVEFDLPDSYEFLHEELDLSWKLRARNETIAEGHEPIGGAYAAHQVGYGSRDGKKTIVYRVPIRMVWR